MDGCLDDATLAAWHTGQVEPATAATVQHHIEGCAACREVCAALVAEAPGRPPVGAADLHARPTADLHARPGAAGPAATSAADLAAADLATADLAAAAARYELQAELVRGGMGRILQAYDRVLQRPVALKCLRDPAGSHARFAREIATLVHLNHPAIVTILDSGWLGPDEPFFAMPLLAGESLQQRLATPRPLPARLALLRTLRPLFGAVAYAHDQGVLHRDIKPHNIFLGRFDECILLDWGLATAPRAASAPPLRPSAPSLPDTTTTAAPDRAPSAPLAFAATLAAPTAHAAGALAAGPLTRYGAGLGTLAYSAPEQLAGALY